MKIIKYFVLIFFSIIALILFSLQNESENIVGHVSDLTKQLSVFSNSREIPPLTGKIDYNFLSNFTLFGQSRHLSFIGSIDHDTVTRLKDNRNSETIMWDDFQLKAAPLLDEFMRNSLYRVGLAYNVIAKKISSETQLWQSGTIIEYRYSSPTSLVIFYVKYPEFYIIGEGYNIR